MACMHHGVVSYLFTAFIIEYLHGVCLLISRREKCIHNAWAHDYVHGCNAVVNWCKHYACNEVICNAHILKTQITNMYNYSVKDILHLVRRGDSRLHSIMFLDVMERIKELRTRAGLDVLCAWTKMNPTLSKAAE